VSQVDFGNILIHNHTMKLRRIILWVYLAGALIFELLSLWSAYDNGGFQRHHSAHDLAILAVFYLTIPLLWPAVVVMVILQLTGVLPSTVTFAK
jgi:hypothetical protein